MQPEAQAALRRVWLKQEQARCQQRVQARPDDVSAWRKLAQMSWEAGELEPALAAFDRALELQPDDALLSLDCAAVCLTLNRFEPALAAVERALVIQPNNSDGLLLRADTLRLLERLVEARAVYEQALGRCELSLSQRLHALSHQVILLVRQQAYEPALVAVEASLRLASEDPQLILFRSTILIRLRRYGEALLGLEPVAQVPELNLEALTNQAWALSALGRFEEAEPILSELHSRYDWRQLGLSFGEDSADQLLSDHSLPKRYTARGLCLYSFFKALAECDWRDYQATLSRLDRLIADIWEYGRVLGTEQHRLLHLPVTPEFLLATARARAVALENYIAPLRQSLALAHSGPAVDGRLRIGYVSGDFRDHATAHLMRKLFHIHDRRRFEIIGYTLRPGDGSVYWHDISGACDQMVDLSSLSNGEAAQRIAADGIHILVDLHGYTRYGRQEIFALRPAPVQVSFLGYPGTLGGTYIPYIIADEVVFPEDLRTCFSEQPVYLPGCYQINDNEQPIANTGMTRADQGLPTDAFVYASFNAGYKIEPVTFASWMKILQQVPGSVLWLLVDSPQMIDYLHKSARECGIDYNRLVFAKRLPKPEHLERQCLADLFLDTFVVNAHTTASDALWAGLPVLTLYGRAFHARVCASLLHAIGLPELVAYNVSDYERLAVAMAEDQVRLAGLRERLQANRLRYPLFDTEGYVRHLERAYELLWQEYLANQPERPIWVAPIC